MKPGFGWPPGDRRRARYGTFAGRSRRPPGNNGQQERQQEREVAHDGFGHFNGPPPGEVMEVVVEQAPARQPAPPSIWMPGCEPQRHVQLMPQVDAPPPLTQREQPAQVVRTVEVPRRHEPTLRKDPQDLRNLIKRLSSNKKASRKNRRRRLAEKCRTLQEELRKLSRSGPTTEVERAFQALAVSAPKTTSPRPYGTTKVQPEEGVAMGFQPLATSTPKEGSLRPYGSNMEEDPPKGQCAMDVEPVRPAVQRAQVEPVRPAVQRAQVEPVGPMVQRAQAEPVRPAVQRAQVAPVRPVVQRSQVAPVRPVVQRAQVEPVRPVGQSTRTRLVNPMAKDYTVPVPPVRSRDPLGLRAEVEAFKAERRRKRAERCSEEPQEIIDLTKGKDSPVQELWNHPPLLEKNSEGKVCIPFLQALKEKYNPKAGLVRLQDLTEIVKVDKMLSDATIMMALDAIVAKAQGRGRKVKAVDTYFFPALKDFGYDQVRHLFLHEDLFELELFLVPIHHPRMRHWSLLAIKPKENKIIVYDSIRRSVHPEVAHVQSFKENHFGDLHGVPNSFKGEDLEKTIAFAGLQEPGSVDCGLFVIEHARLECANAPFKTVDGKKMALYRESIFRELFAIKQALEAL